MAENGKMLGQKYHNGRIWSLRCDGETLPTIAGYHPEERQRKRVRRTLAAR